MNDRYLVLLVFSLLGYAVLGKGFAYAGIPPLFIGEIVLGLGLVALLRSRCLLAAMGGLPSFLLVALMGWVVVRTIPYVAQFGIDALRDSVVALYGLFAFIMIGLLIQRPERLPFLINSYGRFAFIFPLSFVVLFPIFIVMQSSIPTWPISGMPVIFVRLGDACVHLAGITLFTMLGFRQFSLLWMLILFAAIGIAGSQSRGGLLGILVCVGLGRTLGSINRQTINLGIIALFLILLGLTLDIEISIPSPGGHRRDISIRQIASNIMSTGSSSDSLRQESTKEWRLQWWDKIVDYTIDGEYFWGGKGFGVNLADDDGFQAQEESLPGLPLLRSPHNVHMTFLARAGVPGLILWIASCLSWAVTILRFFFISKARGDRAWSRLFLFLFGYWLACIIDASFDVALEGPTMGIWFWSLHGIGIGAAIIYRHEKRMRTQSCR